MFIRYKVNISVARQTHMFLKKNVLGTIEKYKLERSYLNGRQDTALVYVCIIVCISVGKQIHSTLLLNIR